MKKASIAPLSLRKLLLAILAVGPLAILPAPVWATLPTAGTYTLGTGGGSFAVTNGTVIVTNPTATLSTIQTTDRAVLVWGPNNTAVSNFNIGGTEEYNFAQPTSTSAVLNKIGYNTSGGFNVLASATIAGTLRSNGKVFVLANGNIIVSTGATLTTGGLVLSTLGESSDFPFLTTGNLSFTGTNNGTGSFIQLNTLNVVSGGLSAYTGTLQNATTANIINGGTVAGDLLLNTVTATAPLDPANQAALTVTGNLTIITNNGAITQANPITANGVTTLSTTSGTAAITLANVTNDFNTVALTTGTGAASITDINIVTLTNSTLGGALTVLAKGVTDTTAIATSGTLTVAGAATFTQSNATFTGAVANSSISIGNNSTVVGALIGQATQNSAFTFNGTGPITLGASYSGAVGTGFVAGNKTGITVTTNGTLTIAGALVATGNGGASAAGAAISLTGGSIVQSPTFSITTTANGSVSLNATAGGITLGDNISSAGNVTLRSSGGSISQGTSVITTTQPGNFSVNATTGGSIALTGANNLADQTRLIVTAASATINNTAPNTATTGTFIGSTNVTGSYTLNTTNNIGLGWGIGSSAQNIVVGGVLTASTTQSGAVISDVQTSGNGNYTAFNVFGGVNLSTTGGGSSITMNAARQNGNLAPSVLLGAVSANTNNQGPVTIAETQTLNLGTINATTLSAYSVSGNIIQSSSISTSAGGGTTAQVGLANATIVLNGTNNAFTALTLLGGSDASATFNAADTLNVTSPAPGNVTIASTAGKTIKLGAITGPGNLTANSGGTIQATGTVNVGNLILTSTDGTAASITQTGVVGTNGGGLFIVPGTTTITSAGNVTLAGPNDFNTVVLGNLTGDADVRDINNLTISGRAIGNVIANSGLTATNTSNPSVASTYSLTFGNVNFGGLTAISTNAGGGTSGSIVQQAGTAIHVDNIASFTTNNANIVLANVGNSAGPVSFAAGNATVTYTEDGGIRLRGFGAGLNTTSTLTSRTGSIFEDTSFAGAITIANNGTLSLNAPTGSILIGNTTQTTFTTSGNVTAVTANAPTGTVAVTSSTGGNFALGNINANSLSVNGTGSGNITQTGVLNVYGSSGFKSAGNITLTNNANNFGPITINSTALGSAGKSISITEQGTLNLRQVIMPAGTNGTFTATAVNGDIIDTGLGGVVAGGLTSGPGTGVVALSAANGNIVIDDPTSDFPSAAGVVVNAKNVTLSLLGQNAYTLYLGNPNLTSSVSGNLSVSSALGDISNAGTLAVVGDASFQTGTKNITMSQAGNTFGTLRFIGNQISITQSGNMQVVTGSQSIGPATLTTNSGNITIVNRGGLVSFGNTASLSATGNITLPKLIQAVGNLTVNASGTKDLGALSISGDLNGKTPINTGSGAYIAPQP